MTEPTAEERWFKKVTDQHNLGIDKAKQRLMEATASWSAAEAALNQQPDRSGDFVFSSNAAKLAIRTYLDLYDILTGEFHRTPERNTLQVKIGEATIDAFSVSTDHYDFVRVSPRDQPVKPGQEFEIAGVLLTPSITRTDLFISTYGGPAFNLSGLALNEASGGSFVIVPSINASSTNAS